jgi:hypothetical protein
MGTGLLDELLAGQPVSAHASRQARLQRMRNGPSSDGLERQQRMAQQRMAPTTGIHVGAPILQSGTEGNGTPGRAACRTAGERACVTSGKSAADDRWILGGWLEASTATGNHFHDGDSMSP